MFGVLNSVKKKIIDNLITHCNNVCSHGIKDFSHSNSMLNTEHPTCFRIRGAVFEWLAPLSVALLIVTGAGSIGYYFYSKQKLARLKQRCSSPGASDTGIIFG